MLLDWHTPVTNAEPSFVSSLLLQELQAQSSGGEQRGEFAERGLPAGRGVAPREMAVVERVGAGAVVGDEHVPVGEVDLALELGDVHAGGPIELVDACAQSDTRARSRDSAAGLASRRTIRPPPARGAAGELARRALSDGDGSANTFAVGVVVMLVGMVVSSGIGALARRGGVLEVLRATSIASLAVQQ